MAIRVDDISIPIEQYIKNKESARGPKGGQLPCLVCGRGCGPRAAYVHLHDGGDLVVTEEEAAALHPNADMGLYPVGRDCLKAHPELLPYVKV